MQLEMKFPELIGELERMHYGLGPAAKAIGVPHNTLLGIKRGADPRFSTVIKIVRGLNRPLEDVLKEYGDGDSNKRHAA